VIFEGPFGQHLPWMTDGTDLSGVKYAGLAKSRVDFEERFCVRKTKKGRNCNENLTFGRSMLCVALLFYWFVKFTHPIPIIHFYIF
jgi:uncharacterized protein (UPF0548 family)